MIRWQLNDREELRLGCYQHVRCGRAFGGHAARLDAYALPAAIGERPLMRNAEEEVPLGVPRALLAVELCLRGTP